MKPVILGVVGLLLGMGGGTGVTMMKNKKLQAQAAEIAAEAEKSGKKAGEHGDSTHAADSTHADSSHADPAAASHAGEGAHEEPAGKNAAIPSAALAPSKPADAAPDAKGEHGGDHAAGAPAPVESKMAGKGEVRPANGPAAKGPATDAATRAAGFKQLARIFTTMKAADAVKVMALMTDDEVEGVLRATPPKQTAEMLNQFPQQRAAALSRRLLVPTVKE